MMIKKSLILVGLLIGLSWGIFAETITTEEEGILLMREEEKLARDVYLGLYEIWGQRIFTNIAQSEQKHMDAVLTLIDQFGLSDPAELLPAGEFEDSHLQELYNDLMAQGSESLVDAFIVGTTIEDLDIMDLEELLSQTDNPDIIRVYSNLLKGSENHMRSFYHQVSSRGGEYLAQFITQNRLDEIVLN